MVLQHLASIFSIVVILSVLDHATSFRYNCSSSWTSNGGWIEIQYNAEEVMNTDWIFLENPGNNYWGWVEEANAFPGVDITRYGNEVSNSDGATSKITWHQTVQHIEYIGFVAYSTDHNFVNMALLSRMKPGQSGQDPVKGNWISDYIIIDYFPPEVLFSPGDDIALNFVVTDLGDADYELYCKSLHYGQNDTIAYGIKYYVGHNGNEQWSDAVGGVNITTFENGTLGGTSRLIQLVISNATEKHIGKYECSYMIRPASREDDPKFFFANTGARLTSHDSEFPVQVSYEVGYNLLGSGHTDYRAMIPAGDPNIIKCTITYEHLPRNISLYLHDESLQLSGPFMSTYPAYDSVTYQYRIGLATAADAGYYKWLIEIGNRVIEQWINVEVATR